MAQAVANGQVIEQYGPYGSQLPENYRVQLVDGERFTKLTRPPTNTHFVNQIVLKDGEYLTGVSGTYGYDIDRKQVDVATLKIHTNFNSQGYGPYGQGIDVDNLTDFASPNIIDGPVVGVFGRSDGFIESIGVLVRKMLPIVPGQISLASRVIHFLRTLLLEKINVKAVFAPSTIAAIVGFVIGMNSSIRNLMIGNDAPLHIVTDSAFMLGDAAIPTVTIIVGANLLQGLKGTCIQRRVVIGIVVARYIILPLSGILIIKGAIQVGFVPPNNKLFVFLLLLQHAMPPAMNLGTMMQLFGAGKTLRIIMRGITTPAISPSLYKEESWGCYKLLRVAASCLLVAVSGQ
ncbi:hypothetical protein BVRB_6g130120 [Beta vulgaris subsp. vulgaris]|nr:hypothetical protein BVRB_6g130120 [Beta vulgaris subsp. vulgaris]